MPWGGARGKGHNLCFGVVLDRVGQGSGQPTLWVFLPINALLTSVSRAFFP